MKLSSKLDFSPERFHARVMRSKGNVRRLRREQTAEEKELWRALRGRRFAGFKFRRQHPEEDYSLDFYCVEARLAIELDGFQHGSPQNAAHDAERERFLKEREIEVLRFWNHQWRNQREGCLVEIWNRLCQRTGCYRVMTETATQRFVPPTPNEVIDPRIGDPPEG